MSGEELSTTTGNEEAPPRVFKFDGTPLPGIEPAKLQPYNFRDPGFLSQADLRRLNILHEKCIQHLSVRLSTFLRMECMLKVLKFNSSTFAAFTQAIPAQSHVTLFQVAPLRGVGILDVGLRLSLSMADRLLGGKGRLTGEDRALTEIEVALLEDAVQLILVEWTQPWQDDESSFQPQIIGHDTGGRFLQTSAADALLVVSVVEVSLGECVGQMQMGVPFSMIEPMVKKMHKDRHTGEDHRPKNIQWRTPYDGISVPLIADWTIREICVQEVLELQPGDVITLPRDLISQTRIRLSDTPEFVGTVGVQQGHVAVQLTRKTLIA